MASQPEASQNIYPVYL